MAQVAIISFLVGAVFGLRFKVMVLLPLTLATAVIALVIAPILFSTLLEGLAGFAIGTLALHGGYLFGSFSRFTIGAARATRVVARQLKTVR
jgi:hypothetical protein